MKRSPEPWLSEGFALLRTSGEEALTVDRLCRALGKTKGSFYHHFASVEAYADALLARWEADGTQMPIDVSRKKVSPSERAKTLDEVVRGLDHAVDQAIRRWATRDARAREVLARVDARRIAYIEEIHRAAGHASPKTLAMLEYCALLGAQQLFADLASPPAREVERALRRAVRALVASSSAATRG